MAIPLTIKDDVEQGYSQQFSHRNFNEAVELHYTKNGETILIPLNPLINKYKEYFDNWIMEIPLLEREAIEYRYAPKKLSYYFYGTTEFWSLILYINECHSIIDFNPTTSVRLIERTKLKEIMNEIMILEGIV